MNQSSFSWTTGGYFRVGTLLVKPVIICLFIKQLSNTYNDVFELNRSVLTLQIEFT